MFPTCCRRYREKNMISVFVNLFAAISYVHCLFNPQVPSFCLLTHCQASSGLLSLICLPVLLTYFAIWQWAKLASHSNGDVGPAANVVTYKYLDYLATCPLLVSSVRARIIMCSSLSHRPECCNLSSFHSRLSLGCLSLGGVAASLLRKRGAVW